MDSIDHSNMAEYEDFSLAPVAPTQVLGKRSRGSGIGDEVKKVEEVSVGPDLKKMPRSSPPPLTT